MDMQIARRCFIQRASQATALALAGMALPMVATPARAAQSGERRLAFHHTHTGERLSLVFASNGQYRQPALQALNHLLRDHYSGAVGQIDPALFDQLHALQGVLANDAAFEIVSGFRSPTTNTRLRQRGGGGVAQRSLHLEGRAIDVRLPGASPADLRDAAVSLRAGGVGYYARDQFLHLDTGRVRAW